MLHGKVALVDELLWSIGSINFTARSVNRKICRRRDYGRTGVGDGRHSKETNHGKKHTQL